MKTKSIAVFLLASFVIALAAFAAENEGKQDQQNNQQAASKVELETEMQKVSYIIGTQLATNFQQQNIEIEPDALVAGMKDVLDEKELAISQEEMQQVMQQWQMKMMQQQQEQMQKDAAENKKKGEAFLEENKKEEGVKVTDSGLQYKVLEEGDGEKPEPTDMVKVHYRGTLLDGTEFDSSYQRGEPAIFQLDQVVPGWTEGLQLMKEGAKYKFWIPADLAYGDRGTQNIPAGSTLVFEVELLEVNPEQPQQQPQQQQGQQINPQQ